jgi:hypothetical protein
MDKVIEHYALCSDCAACDRDSGSATALASQLISLPFFFAKLARLGANWWAVDQPCFQRNERIPPFNQLKLKKVKEILHVLILRCFQGGDCQLHPHKRCFCNCRISWVKT